MKPRLIDAVRLDIVLVVINAVLDLRQDLAPENVGRILEDLVERRLERIDAIALGKRDDAARAEAGGTDLGIHIPGGVLRKPRGAGDDTKSRLVQNPTLEEFDWRDA